MDTRTTNQRFVASLYEDLLQRPAEAGGLTFWSGLIDQGTSRFDVTRATTGVHRAFFADHFSRILLLVI